MNRLILKVHGGAGASGPLLFIRGGRRLALGERVVVELPDAPPRSGQLVEACLDSIEEMRSISLPQ